MFCVHPNSLSSSPPAGYLVLEGYGGPGESSTEDEISAKHLGASRGCAGDSGISLRFSSASQAGSLSSFSRLVLSHLRHLQTNPNHLTAGCRHQHAQVEEVEAFRMGNL